MPKRKSSRTTSILFLLLNVLLWGAALPIVKPAFETTTPFRFLFYRFLFASFLSIPILFYYLPQIKHFWTKVKTIACVELFQILELALLYTGLALTSSLEASLIATTTPIFTTLGGIIFLKEKQERREWLGLTLAFVGTILLAVEPLMVENGVETSFSFRGNLLIFLQNICLAAYFLLAKKQYNKIPKLFATTISFYVGAVCFLVLSFLEIRNQDLSLSNGLEFGIPLASYSDLMSVFANELFKPTVLFATLYMSLFGSIIGLTAYIKGQDGIEASEAALFSYLQPLVYIPLAVFWLHESITWPMIVAVLIIGMGVFVAERR